VITGGVAKEDLENCKSQRTSGTLHTGGIDHDDRQRRRIVGLQHQFALGVVIVITPLACFWSSAARVPDHIPRLTASTEAATMRCRRSPAWQSPPVPARPTPGASRRMTASSHM